MQTVTAASQPNGTPSRYCADVAWRNIASILMKVLGALSRMLDQSPTERKLAAIFAADVVGFSRLVEQDEAGALAAVRDVRLNIINPQIASQGGRIFKLMGDGVLAEFPDGVGAMRAALEIQEQLRIRNGQRSLRHRIELRIGIHQDDVVVEGEDLLGDGVNIAARLETLAEPGGVCFSVDVRHSIADKMVVRSYDLGEPPLKNITRPVRVYTVRTTAEDQKPRLTLPPTSFRWPPHNDLKRAPFRGLEPLESVDAGVFFGRDGPITEALQVLQNLREGAAPRLFVVLGASGAGKSAFLRAGLLPRLMRDEAHYLLLPVIRPERAAIKGASGLLAALAAACVMEGAIATGEIIQATTSVEVATLRSHLRDLSERHKNRVQASHGAAVVIAIDQAEELFRAEGIEEGERLLALLRDLMEADDPAIIVIFAIRSDSYDRLERAKPLEGVSQSPFALLPMPRSAYKDVIEGPIKRLEQAGRPFEIEPALTQTLLEDIEKGGSSDALPLLAFVLEQLYRDYEAAGRIRRDDYQNFGGLKGAIDAAVERAFRRADLDQRIPKAREAREAILRRGLVPWLAGVDPDSKTPRRNRARVSDLPADAVALIDLLVDERLLSTHAEVETDLSTGVDRRIVKIEPAHEALLRQWSLLDGWLRQDGGLLATLENIKRAALDWETNGRADVWLVHQGRRLSEAVTVDARPDIAVKFDSIDRTYLVQCRAKEDSTRAEAECRQKEREEEQARRLTDARALAIANRQTARRTGLGLIAALILTAIALLFGAVARHEKTIADQNTSEAQIQRDAGNEARKVAVAREAEARRNQAAALTALSNLALPTDPARAVKLALAASLKVPEDRAPTLATLQALDAAILQQRERRIFRGHEGAIWTAAFSPDGTQIVTGSRDGTARVWDAVTGKALTVLRGHSGLIRSVVFSPEGTTVLTGGEDETARIWDASTGRQLALLRGHRGSIGGAVFSQDGARVLTFSEDKTARIWDASTGQEMGRLVGHEGSVTSAVFSPNGKTILTTSADKTARMWDAETGRETFVLRGHAEKVWSGEFSRDGRRIVTASEDDTARLWDAATGRELAVLRGSDIDTGVANARFSPDGALIVTIPSMIDRTARLWDAVTGDLVFSLIGHRDLISNVEFSPDSARVLTSSLDGTARLWSVSTGQQLALLRGHEGPILSAAFSPDGARAVTASDDNTARMWDVGTGLRNIALRGHESLVSAADFSPNGTMVITGSEDGTARLWDAETGKQLSALRSHSGPIWGVSFSHDGRELLTASDDNTAALWDAQNGEEIAVLRGHEGAVRSAEFSPDGRRIVTGSTDGTARLWDRATGEGIAILRGHAGVLTSVRFSPSGTRIATSSTDGSTKVWDAATGANLFTLLGHNGAVLMAAFSPDSKRIVTASEDATARIWDALSGASLLVLRGHDGKVRTAVFSADGARIVTASDDKTARLWDANSGQQIATLRGHSDVVTEALFSPDGARILTASWDRSARIWDSFTGQQVVVLLGHAGAVWSAAFSPDGMRVITTSGDATARLWDVKSIPQGDLFRTACAWLPDRDLNSITQAFGLTNLGSICEN